VVLLVSVAMLAWTVAVVTDTVVLVGVMPLIIVSVVVSAMSTPLVSMGTLGAVSVSRIVVVWVLPLVVVVAAAIAVSMAGVDMLWMWMVTLVALLWARLHIANISIVSVVIPVGCCHLVEAVVRPWSGRRGRSLG